MNELAEEQEGDGEEEEKEEEEEDVDDEDEDAPAPTGLDLLVALHLAVAEFGIRGGYLRKVAFNYRFHSRRSRDAVTPLRQSLSPPSHFVVDCMSFPLV